MNHNHSQHKHTTECTTCGPATVWYKEPLYIVFGILVLVGIIQLIFLISGIKILNPFFVELWRFIKLIWWGILLGLLLGGIIESIIPSEFISKYLGAKGIKTILWSTVFGFLMSACSHGILSIAVALFRKGSTTAAILTFLLAAPWANPAITVLLIVLFKAKAFLLIGGALVIAIISGLIFQYLEKRKIIEQGHPVEVKEDFSLWQGIKERFRAKSFKAISKDVLLGSWRLAKMTLYWILIGVVVGSAISAFVPVHFLNQYFGVSLLGLLLTLGVATIIEVCSEGSAPIAFELYRRTGAFGNAFVFLQAGVVTDYTEIGLIATNIGKRAAIVLPLVSVPQVIILGYLLNVLS